MDLPVLWFPGRDDVETSDAGLEALLRAEGRAPSAGSRAEVLATLAR